MENNLRDYIKQKFSALRFEEQRHLYFVGNEGLPSVSSKIEKHSPKFDLEKYSRLCAIKEGVTQDEMKQKWGDYNKERIAVGSITHNFLEVYNGTQSPRTNEERAGVLFLKEHLNDYDILDREVRMYSWVFKYAGTADIPLVNRKTGGVVIADYKTNIDLFKSYDFLYPPFQYLESSPYNKYQLQLSYYQIMLEEIGVKVEDRWVVHLRGDGTYKKYDTYDYAPYLIDHMKKQAA